MEMRLEANFCASLERVVYGSNSEGLVRSELLEEECTEEDMTSGVGGRGL